jgi:hypothetical protein
MVRALPQEPDFFEVVSKIKGKKDSQIITPLNNCNVDN